MPISKDDRAEIAEMISRAVVAASPPSGVVPGAVASEEDIEAAAASTDPLQSLYVEFIQVSSHHLDWLDPDSTEIVSEATIRGRTLSGDTRTVKFRFPPDPVELLAEIKRVQDHRHLLDTVSVVRFLESADSVPRLVWVSVNSLAQ